GHDPLVAQSPFPDEVDDYSVALPPAGWYDYWTGAQVEGSTGRKAIDNSEVQQPEVHLQSTAKELPVFVRAGAIVPEQPLVQSTEEKPEGPLTLRVYTPTKAGTPCRGTVYLDDGVSYDFRKGDFLRESFTCEVSADGITVTVAPREGSFGPWWKQLSVEVYGAVKPAAAVTVSAGGSATEKTASSFDREHHRITMVVPDDGKGQELRIRY
ncbi:MAG: DUF5110 domain-containing protein, partial [Terracidiphilus sp.]